MDGPASLDVVEDVVRRELGAQQRRADAADTRAGLVLGFAGLVVSFAGDGGSPFGAAAVLVAGAAALVALAATGVLVGAETDVRAVGTRFLGQTATATRLALLWAHLTLYEGMHRRLDRKLARVRLASRLLTVALVLAVAGATVEKTG